MSYLANVTISVSITNEIALFKHGKGGFVIEEKRLITWDAVRAVVQYMLANKLDQIESWFGDPADQQQLVKYELTVRKL